MIYKFVDYSSTTNSSIEIGINYADKCISIWCEHNMEWHVINLDEQDLQDLIQGLQVLQERLNSLTSEK